MAEGPYVRRALARLGSRDPLEALAEGPERIARAVADLDGAALRRPEAPGRWSVLDAVRHLADTELVYGLRLRLMLAEDRPILPRFSQEAWTERLRRAGAALDRALDDLRALRAINLRLVENLDESDLARTGVHDRRGEETVGDTIRLLAAHDLIHLDQIRRIRAAAETADTAESAEHGARPAAAPEHRILVEAMGDDDWPSVRAIYAEGIASGDATFETELPPWPAWDAEHLESCRLVARDGDARDGDVASIIGWAALSPTSHRAVYRGVAETSVYVATRARGRGVGKALLEALIAAADDAGIWTLQATIFPENRASIALHRRYGFRRVGLRHRLGHDRRQDRWRDVVLLERRSDRVGGG